MFEDIEKTQKKITALYPDYHNYLTFLKKVFRHEFRKNWFRRISTSILENGVFRSVSETWIMKAYIDDEKYDEIQPVYYYYIDHFLDNIFQQERIGWEIIWENDPVLDAICIYITYKVLNKIWINNFNIYINSIWVEKEQLKYKEELTSFYENKKHLLSPESVELIDKNPMLILSSQNEDEKILALEAPKITKFLKKDSKAHYSKFKEYLDLLEVPYTEDHTIIPKNEYNTNTVWKIIYENWDIIWEWARYNTLAKQLWNKNEVPATWFFNNSLTIIKILKEKNISIKNKDKVDLFFVQLWDEAKQVVLPLSIQAREAWINTVVSLWTPSMKEQMLKANRSEARYVVMVWLMEARNWVFQVRDIISWTQAEVKKDELIEYVSKNIWLDKLDFYCPAKDLITN